MSVSSNTTRKTSEPENSFSWRKGGFCILKRLWKHGNRALWCNYCAHHHDKLAVAFSTNPNNDAYIWLNSPYILNLTDARKRVRLPWNVARVPPSTFCVYLQIQTISLKYNQQDATFSLSIYSYKLLYMFQTVPPPIIRSTKLYIQRQVLSNQYCSLLQQAAVLVWQYLTL